MATIPELARRIDLSERHVKTLIDSGVLKRAAHSQHDLDAQTIRYIRHLRQIKTATEGGGPSSLSEARSRLVTAKASSAELQNEIERGLWCRTADAAACYNAELSVLRETLLTMTGELIGLLGPEGGQLVESRVHGALDDMADSAHMSARVIDRTGASLKKGKPPSDDGNDDGGLPDA